MLPTLNTAAHTQPSRGRAAAGSVGLNDPTFSGRGKDMMLDPTFAQGTTIWSMIWV